MTPSAAKKEILKIENDIVRENKIFCANNNIQWLREHDVCLRNALRTYFGRTVPFIVNDMLKLNEIVFTDDHHD